MKKPYTLLNKAEPYLWILPSIILMSIFIIIPIALVLFYAFTDANGSFTFENVLSIWEYRSTYIVSIELAFVATIICLLLAYPVAYFISRLHFSKEGGSFHFSK